LIKAAGETARRLRLLKAHFGASRAARFPLFALKSAPPTKPARLGGREGFGRLGIFKQVQ
jgi:hypothetical protein